MYLMDKSILEIFNLYRDNEIGRLIINSTQNYASQKFDQSFLLSKDQLWDFLVITIMAPFNIRPQLSLYWSNEEDVSSPLMRSLMSHNT